MNRAKRLLAIIITVIMAVSMMTVITFAAETPVFARDYVDPTGTITREACLVDPNVAGKKQGDTYDATLSDGTYRFTVGVNAFAKLDAGIEGANMLSESGIIQILLAPSTSTYGDITITSPIEIYGYNWNINPNSVNPTDPTKGWVQNTAWNDKASIISNLVISASAIGNTKVYGVTISGRLYDNQRPLSTVKTALVFKNILFSQTAEGTSNIITTSPGRAVERYAITFYNANAKNFNESGKRNVDELSLINWRFEKLAGTCNRLIDELGPPKVTMDGCYLNNQIEGMAGGQGWWLKWGKFFTNCKYILTNSCIENGKGNSIFHFEGYISGTDSTATKLPVGTGGDDQYSEINITNNLFYNAATTGNLVVAINLPSYSKVDISNNVVVNTADFTASSFINMAYPDSSKDYSDIVTMRDNTVIGLTNFGFSYGNSETKVDMTGTYVTSKYTDSWKSETSTELPAGNVRYDYCYLDANRTRKSSDIPAFTANGIAPDNVNRTIALSAAAGTKDMIPAISGLTKYEIYESDKDFSNAGDYSESVKSDTFTLVNYKNYYLLVAYSYDLNTPVAYKVTLTKANTTIDPGDLIITTPGATQRRDGLVYYIDLERDTDNVSFGFNGSIVNIPVSSATSPSGETILDNPYGVSKLEPNDTAEFIFETHAVADASKVEYFYVYVTRGLSKKCDIISAQGVNFEGTSMSATVPGNVAVFNFSVVLPVGATAAAWIGTTVYVMDESGNFAIDQLKSGMNELTVGVTAENGVDYKLYTLSLDKEKNTEAKVISIANAVEENGSYTATARSKFEVKPIVSSGATFKVFKDAACSQLIENNIVSVAGDITVYIVVTSESGTNVSAPVALTIKKSDDGISVAGATIDSNDANLYVLKLADNLSAITLTVNAKNVTYKLYSDKKLTNEASAELKLDQGITYVYAKVTYTDNATDIMTIKVVSNRSAVAYKDSSSIPNWAKTYIDKLAANGLGILKGDTNGNFNASNSMTRYEVAAIAVRLLGIDATQYSGVNISYTDTIAPWAVNYVKAVTKLGIMSGSADASGNLVFNGAGATTRAQLAKIIVEVSFFDNQMAQDVNAYYLANKEAVDSYYNAFNFADEDSVQNWAKTYVKLAVYAKYFNGSAVNGRNYINGQDNIKRSEIAAVATRFLGL